MDPTGLFWLEGGHWGFTTVVYLFFASLAGGAYLAGVAAYTTGRAGDRERLAFTRWAFLVALVAVAVAGVAILSHLADPIAGLLFPLTLRNFGSWITRGTWILVSLGGIVALVTLWVFFGSADREATAASRPVRSFAGLCRLRGIIDRFADRSRPSSRRFGVIAALGLLPAVGTIYTGFELAAVETVPLWHEPAVVPLLFLASGVAAGIAATLALTVSFDGAGGRLVVVAGGAVCLALLGTAGLLWTLWSGLGASPAGSASAAQLSGPLGAIVTVLVVGLVASLVGSPLLAWLWHAGGESTTARWLVRPGLVASLLVAMLAAFLVRYLLVVAAVKDPLVVVG